MQQLYRDGLFEGEVVIVTGGGSGIGLTVAREVGALGAAVAICGRRPEPLEEARALLESEGISALAQTCDTRDDVSVGGFVDAVLERFGRIDVLVNNAGGQFPSPAAGLSPRGFQAVVRNNLFGTWNFIHATANKAMIPARSGRIVNITAQVSRGFPGMAHTGAARAGVENLTKTLAVEWAYQGIRVNAVAPGIIRTSGTKQYPPMLLERGRQSIPMKRLGTSEEVSHLITYLASRASAYVTGQTFTIDGGQGLWGDSWEIPDDVPTARPIGEESD